MAGSDVTISGCESGFSLVLARGVGGWEESSPGGATVVLCHVQITHVDSVKPTYGFNGFSP